MFTFLEDGSPVDSHDPRILVVLFIELGHDGLQLLLSERHKRGIRWDSRGVLLSLVVLLSVHNSVGLTWIPGKAACQFVTASPQNIAVLNIILTRDTNRQNESDGCDEYACRGPC